MMVEVTKPTRWLAVAGAAALAAATGMAGYWLGQDGKVVGASPAEDGKEEAHEEAGHAEEAAEILLDASQVRASGIEVEAVSDAAYVGQVTASGRIVPAAGAESQATARAGGTVIKLVRNLGDVVRAGDALAVLDSREVAEARAELAKARRAEALASSTYNRERILYRERVTAQADFQQATAARDAAAVDSRLAAEALRALGVAPSATGGRSLTVLAPSSGAVVAVETRPGETVDAAKPLFRIANQRVVWAELLVPAREIGRIRRNSSVTIEAQGEGHSHIGRIKVLSPTIDPATGAATAIVEIVNFDGELAVGKLVNARIAATGGAGTARSVTVPRDAIQEVEGKSLVFVRTPRGFMPREVVVAPGTGTRAAILSGLRTGERIAVTNSFILKAELGKGEAEHEH